MVQKNTFEAMKIGLASPDKIRQWSWGEVKKPETINYRTLKPEKEGLFCEKIFGPTKDYECNCGKYKRIRYKGIVCEKCGVEVTKSKVRRERMGHIELATPVSHIWYFKGIPSRMGLLLDMSPRALEKVLYFASFVVIDPGKTDLYEKQLLTEQEYEEYCDKYEEDVDFRAKMGAEAIKELLQKIDLQEEYKNLTETFEGATGQKKVRILRRLEVVEAFIESKNDPSWMIMDVIPVIPPDIRPMVQLEGGRFATSDLNDLYRRVINRNNRLKRLLDIGSPEIIVRNEKRMLQEAVDALIDNGRRGKPVTGPGNRPLKSLSDMLKGKSGRFRQNLLGKRVDYSGRSVIVIGPNLKFYQCGLPKKMALELFKPFVIRELVKREISHNVKNAKKLVERENDKVWDVLEDIIVDHPVLLNRAPTLHRLGIQAFEPILVEGKAIKLHPLVCTAYNADFDGDQMAVHLPLSPEAQAEARLLMLSTNNILAPKDGKPITTPSQDMVLGSFYMTTRKEGQKGEGLIFKDIDEMMLAYAMHYVTLQTIVKVKRDSVNNDGTSKIVESTVGRFIFNEGIPQDLGMVNREEDPYSLEVDLQVDKKMLSKIIDLTFRKYGNIRTAELLDYIKSMGYKYSTIGALTISMGDITIPDSKKVIIEQAEQRIDMVQDIYLQGDITNEERYKKVIGIWEQCIKDVTKALMTNLPADNNLNIMAVSGARGSENQIRQLGGMRGLMSDTAGNTIEIPITSNFREGLSVQEFFISTHGSRKGLSDTALRTADSGYLTRRLVDVSQDVIITEDDCGTDEYIVAKEIKDGNRQVEDLKSRIIGRYAFEDILDLDTGEIIVHKNDMINEAIAERIESKGIKEVKVRSVLGCKMKHGVCAKCYGRNLATGKPVNIGEAVGIIAAQSIGEPGTQLTMRTFHSGGIAGVGITSGLPRVEELFEARKPKGLAYITEIEGTVKIQENKKRNDVIVTAEDGEEKVYQIPYGAHIRVNDGDHVEKGEPLTEGSINPQDILRVNGAEGVRDYIIREVQKVYRLQGVDIDDKHIEIIIRQMMSKIKVDESGDSGFLSGSVVDARDFKMTNEQLVKEGKTPATGTHSLMGITKASLATESFLSAASFQETTRVLTETSIKGKVDHLIGLKENVIIGKLIPAGTGIAKYDRIEVDYDGKAEEDIIEAEKAQELNDSEEAEESTVKSGNYESLQDEDK
ncbi:DNA-directed RNA polymerase subunit beta' [Finegoldia magna]|uniref:DNA-directed RNA polymerase subunit beta' n=1 Tax=Finegoldia magna TaxID=1260 RepID=UPI000B9168E3|nr:DNA-directed RNA polymerase subunit beta' [Finegoldia magna]MDU2219432.1 DNA-directed RNA polymerase subunit beta' [Finegoldia magna]MDU4278390.1 DNA-directed RNA polymerase subunit beta' [Finegoldia magna]MDU5070911.1 DNA-directed RNA polymerase subunit beta' [Finegoldia magna]MDU6551717.1 DNA-directed RNA polymerase subunit beta' [Finegoldia magna]OXZ34521.1 DNA-directed RNA polymerase subunit beta' [Finegoldia magna]